MLLSELVTRILESVQGIAGCVGGPILVPEFAAVAGFCVTVEIQAVGGEAVSYGEVEKFV